MLKKTWNILKNKYAITLVLMASWLLFFDKNDFVSQMDLASRLKQLNSEKGYYVDEIQKSRSDLNELKTNPKNLEKFAREKYMMKKDNEEVFILVENKQ